MEMVNKKILVVDDDRGILDSFEVLLGDRYDLVMTDNGYEALKMIEDDPPHLMFLDIKMPGLDGMSVLRKVRERKKKVEVVIITATQREETEKEAMSLGAIDFLRKPLNIVEVERIASQVLS